ncbi:hypothetical protein ACFFX0_10765 [Citricoccus parietis]|uniref:Uncharacterized protein n=1 Tax=Citricoccus parietis TaxID=592307 RepID=A0ABV5FY90_9MICC
MKRNHRTGSSNESADVEVPDGPAVPNVHSPWGLIASRTKMNPRTSMRIRAPCACRGNRATMMPTSTTPGSTVNR